MTEPKAPVQKELNNIDYETWKKYYEQYQQELREKRRLEKEKQERRDEENEKYREAEQERIRKQHETYWANLKQENDLASNKAERSKKMKLVIDEIKNICLDNFGDNNIQRITIGDKPQYLDVGEDANTFLMQLGMLRIIDYVNLMMKKHNLSSEESYDIFDSINVAAKICCETGFSKYSEKDKLEELFKWAKVGV